MSHGRTEYQPVPLVSVALATILCLICFGIKFIDAFPHSELLIPPQQKLKAELHSRYDPETFLNMDSTNFTNEHDTLPGNRNEQHATGTGRDFSNSRSEKTLPRPSSPYKPVKQFHEAPHTKTSRSYPTEYIIETTPQDTENLEPDQWIYFRICTVPVLNSEQNTPNGFEMALEEELMKTSCLPRNVKRPVFSSVQRLIITARGIQALVYDIKEGLVHFSSSVFDRTSAKFWSLKSKRTILFGLRPLHPLEHQILDVYLERSTVHESINTVNTYSKAFGSTWNPKKFPVPSHFDQVKGANYDFEEEAPEAEQLSVYEHDESLKISLLKRIIIRFVDEPRRLVLRCNKTGPILIFDQFQLLKNGNNLSTSELPEQTLNQLIPTDVYKPARIDGSELPNAFADNVQENAAKFTQSQPTILTKHGFDLYGSSSLVLLTESPEPLIIDEVMNELAVNLAYKRLQPEHSEPTAMYNNIPTGPSLLVPSEPIPGTLIYVVKLGESIRIRCQGLEEDKPLRLIFDHDVWDNLSLHHSFLSSSPLELFVSVTLRARSITWEDVSKEPIDGALRFADQSSEVKCGSHRHNRFWEPNYVSSVRQTPVSQLYFTIVSPADHILIKKWLADKRSQLFSSEITPNRSQQSPIMFNIAARIFLVSENVSEPHSKLVGFWNMSLSHLSPMKLTTCVVLVFLMVSLLILLICQYSCGRPHTEHCRAIISEGIGRTWESNDQESINRSIELPAPWYYIFSRLFKRHNNNANHQSDNRHLDGIDGDIDIRRTTDTRNSHHLNKQPNSGNQRTSVPDQCRTRRRPP